MARRTSDDPLTVVSLNDVTLDDRNANRGTARGRTALAHSLRDHGAGRSIVVDRRGRVLCGNKVVTVARDLQLPLTVVRTAGDHLVVVQRKDLDLASDPKARELALADNRVGELDLQWDAELLKGFAQEIDLEPFWTADELEQLLGQGLAVGNTPEDALVVPPPTSIERGQLFALGTHRVLCGDATDSEAVARLLANAQPVLMTTDPPYGVMYDPMWRAERQLQARTAVGSVANDDRVDWSAAFALFPGAVAYVWHGGLHAGTVAASLTRCAFDIRAQIIWVKQHFAFSRGLSLGP